MPEQINQPFTCDYCSEAFTDRQPIKIAGRDFCTRLCKDRYFAPKNKESFKSISSI